MMLLPLAAGVLLVRDERDLDAAFAQRAPYLFHAAKANARWDQGTRSFQCSRRADVIKLWVALQRYGVDGIGALYERLCDVAHGDARPARRASVVRADARTRMQHPLLSLDR